MTSTSGLVLTHIVSTCGSLLELKTHLLLLQDDLLLQHFDCVIFGGLLVSSQQDLWTEQNVCIGVAVATDVRAVGFEEETLSDAPFRSCLCR